MNATAVAVLGTVVAVLLTLKKEAPKLAAVAALLASLAVTGGVLVKLRDSLGHAADATASKAATAIVGQQAAGIIALVLAGWLTWDLWPKHKASRWTAAAAFLLPGLAATAPKSMGGDVIRSTLDGIASLIGA